MKYVQFNNFEGGQKSDKQWYKFTLKGLRITQVPRARGTKQRGIWHHFQGPPITAVPEEGKIARNDVVLPALCIVLSP